VPSREHDINKRNADTHLLILEFYIVNPLNLTNTTFLDAITYYDDIQLNILKSAVQDLINNGTFDIANFVLTPDSFATPSYGDIICDDGYMLDQSTCSKIHCLVFVLLFCPIRMINDSLIRFRLKLPSSFLKVKYDIL
jgi:hypothetical protein